MNGNTIDRLSQKGEPRNAKVNSILEEAAEVAGGVLSSIQALAGTTACKGGQIARLKEWAVNIIYQSATGGYDTYRSLSPNILRRIQL